MTQEDLVQSKRRVQALLCYMLRTGVRLICVKEAAELLQVTDRTCRKLLRTGQIEGFKLNGRPWRTTERHVEVYIARCLHERRLALRIAGKPAA